MRHAAGATPGSDRRGWVWPAVALAAVALGAMAPLGLYQVLWGSPMIRAEEALDRLMRAGDSAVLVDIRPQEDFERRHVQAARNWPLSEIEALAGSGGVPAPFRGKTLYLICEAGLSSGLAARALDSLGVREVYSVAGGMQAWVGACRDVSGSEFCRWGSATAGWAEAPFQTMSSGEQWAAVLSAFVVKPLYMLGAALLLLVLRDRAARDLSRARWGVVAFLAGETCCAANYLLFQGDSVILDYWHAVGMVIAFGLVGWALMEGADSRFLHLSDERPCVSLRMCGACIKNRNVPCAARRGFLLVSALGATLACIPLLAPLRTEAYNTLILGTPYTYLHPAVLQLFESRYAPLVALLLLAGAWASLIADRRRAASPLARALFAAGIGALGFGVFRLMLGSIFAGNLVWASFWEELTELEFIIGTAAVLWIFRGPLLVRSDRVPLEA